MTFEELVNGLYDRRILLSEENINDSCVGRLRMQFIQLNLRDSRTPIRFYIDTRYGDVDEALSLVSTMGTIDAPIIGLVDGKCDAYGLALLQSCGIRLSTPFARFKLQRISSSSSFCYNGTNISEKFTKLGAHLELMQEKLDRVIMGKREGRELRGLHLREYYDEQKVFFGEDAPTLGFVDEVVGKGIWEGEHIVLPSKIGFQQ